MYPSNPNIGIIADIAQLIVYMITLLIVMTCKHPPQFSFGVRAVFVTFALALPEVFLLYALLCHAINIERKICCM